MHKQALISISNKQGIVEFASGLAKLGIALLSTGGTAGLLRQANLDVTEVSTYTGFPEIMGGRVKTLHPKIHGGLLGRLGIDEQDMRAHGIHAIDLLVVNLYPFQQVTQQPACDLATAIENIDIGGPAMIRAAAKNYQRVTVVVDPDDYPVILEEMRSEGHPSEATRYRLACKAFAHTAQYDAAIARYLQPPEDRFPEVLNLHYRKKLSLRYGENPHQQAACYVEPEAVSGNIVNAVQHQGKALSYNNIADSDAALACVKAFHEQPACVIVKHANPCGVALANDLTSAYQRAYATDPSASFGGIIAFNRCLDEKTAEAIIAQQFVEVIVAPSIEEKALRVLSQKPNVRALSTGQWSNNGRQMDYKRIAQGLLMQTGDDFSIAREHLTVVTQRQPTEAEYQDSYFAWRVAKHLKSNAIVYAKHQATIGLGAGQMSRIDSVKIAGLKALAAKLPLAGSVMASDAFFPFSDSVEEAAAAGITAIIQPGGSMRDDEVIAAANKAGIAMLLTGIRHFKH